MKKMAILIMICFMGCATVPSPSGVPITIALEEVPEEFTEEVPEEEERPREQAPPGLIVVALVGLFALTALMFVTTVTE